MSFLKGAIVKAYSGWSTIDDFNLDANFERFFFAQPKNKLPSGRLKLAFGNTFPQLILL
jgi:hypothetical protein